MIKALGCHVFAGGMTAGFKDVFDVKAQLEVHGLGDDTVEKVWKVPVIRPADGACAWPAPVALGHGRIDVLYGNPRCTAFSNVTAGLSSTGHGPEARQCQDVKELVDYGLAYEFSLIVWESVQQAYRTGKPLVDSFTRRFIENGYRVAHVFVNARTFGNAQNRKRYFQVAYPRDRQFNVDLPPMLEHAPMLWDAISERRHRECNVVDPLPMIRDGGYDQDSYLQLTADEWHSLPHMASGWDANTLAQYDYEKLSPAFKAKWDERMSDMPFSMHGVHRPAWMCAAPTLTNSCCRLLHPWWHRPCTVGELADIMGWRGEIPVGPDPFSQIAKGVVPDVATWIAEMCRKCLEDEWGGPTEDWSTRYDHVRGVFEGEDTSGQDEKVIDVTQYYPRDFDIGRFPAECQEQCHRFNVDPKTGRLIRKWKEIA